RSDDRTGTRRAGAHQEGPAIDTRGTVRVVRTIAHAAPPRAFADAVPRGFRGFRTIAAVGKKSHSGSAVGPAVGGRRCPSRARRARSAPPPPKPRAWPPPAPRAGPSFPRHT